MPPFSAASGLGICTNTRIARVPASVMGLMRSTLPSNERFAETVDAKLDGHRNRDLRNVVGGHHRLQLHLSQIDDREQRRVEVDLLAGLHMTLGQCARQRRGHHRVVQRIARQLHLCFIGLERALRDRKVAIGTVVGVLRDESLLEQRVVLRARLLGERELGAARLEGSDAVVELGLEIGGVQAREHLPALDRFALAHEDLPDLTRDLGFHRGLVDRLQRARNRQPAGKLPRLDPRHVSRRELERDRSGATRLGGRLVGHAQGNAAGGRRDHNEPQNCTEGAARSKPA